MPLVNYVIFGDSSQKRNRRNTISYSREEKRATVEDALDVYESLARSLRWPDYFRLLKSLLYRLQRVASRANLAKAENSAEDHEQEKTVTKCLCRVLNGFHFAEVSDALPAFLAERETTNSESLDQRLGEELQQVFQAPAEEASDSESEAEPELIKAEDEASPNDIQSKLFSKVLPVLERHLTEAPSSKS